jgi:hypothetical protein
MNFRKYIQQSFPSPVANWNKDIILLSLFVSLFLIVFQPINISFEYKLIILAGYGLISYLTGALLHLFCLNFFPNYFKEEIWTIKRHFIWYSIQFFFIGITNHIYSIYLIPFHPKGIEGLILFEFRAFSLGIPLILVQVAITYNHLLSRNLKEVIEINKKLSQPIRPESTDDVIRLRSDNEKDTFEVIEKELLYIESVGNYIQIFYQKNGAIQNTILRCSLKKAESYLTNHPGITKCHRAYLVNLRFVTYVKGNSQGFKLLMNPSETEIPVARNYAKAIREHLELLHIN